MRAQVGGWLHRHKVGRAPSASLTAAASCDSCGRERVAAFARACRPRGAGTAGRVKQCKTVVVMPQQLQASLAGNSAAAPSRGATPPRSGTGRLRLLRICFDNRVLGSVEVTDGSSLADVRTSITEDEIPGVPESYLFLFCNAPVSRRQEGRRRAVDCFPFLTIIPEGAQIAAREADGDARGSVSGADRADRADRAERMDGSGGATPSPGGAPPLALDHFAGRMAERADEANADGDAAEDLGLSQGATLVELNVTDGPLEGTTLTVGEEGARIGRHTSNTLVIPEAGISRYHCEICCLDGEYCVRDLGSTMGTFFHLRPHSHFLMFVGLMVKFGETELQVLSQTVPGAEAPEQVVLFCEGPFAGHKVHIPATGITIGRRHDNHLVLVQDGTVSAHHAEIFCEDGEFYMTDLGSCNGTCVRLSPERADSDWHPILDGDILGFGCTKIRCRLRPAE